MNLTARTELTPSTVERVPLHASEEQQQRIDRKIEERIASMKNADRAQIDTRLKELEREWGIERAIEANASTLVIVGTALGAFMNRRFLVLPALVGGFLLKHALQGWCPSVPVLRRLGFRTSYEIDRERYALKALRGDFMADTLESRGP